MRIAFFGTPETAVPYLRRLAEEQEIVAVVTQPDRPAGRGRRLAPPPVKVEAQRLGLPVLQPPRVRSAAFCECTEIASAQLVVVVAYGQILPEQLCATASRPAINLHYSLLPQLRGAAPVPWALLRGLSETGVTVQYIAEELDSGDIILQQTVPISPDDDSGSLFQKLQVVGVPTLSEAVRLIAEGAAPRRPQDPSQATFAPPLSPADAAVDWSRSAAEIANQVRAFSPYPGAYCHYRGVRLKLYAAQATACAPTEGKPGEIVRVTPQGFVVGAGAGCVQVGEVQPAGKRRMAACDFARGARLGPGEALENGQRHGEQPQ